MDYMKTLMQTDNLLSNQYKNLRDVFSQKYREGGFKGYYTGLGVMLLRAIGVNAGTLFAFECSMRVLGRSSESE